MGYTLIEKQVLYDGTKVRLEVHHLENQETGKRGGEVCAHPAQSVVLPFLDERTILLIRTKRYAVGQILIELPAGTLEKNEPPSTARDASCLRKPAILQSVSNQ